MKPPITLMVASTTAIKPSTLISMPESEPAAIKAPTLLLYGADSWASNPEGDGRLDHFANARVIEFENLGLEQHARSGTKNLTEFEAAIHPGIAEVTDNRATALQQVAADLVKPSGHGCNFEE